MPIQNIGPEAHIWQNWGIGKWVVQLSYKLVPRGFLAWEIQWRHPFRCRTHGKIYIGRTSLVNDVNMTWKLVLGGFQQRETQWRHTFQGRTNGKIYIGRTWLINSQNFMKIDTQGVSDMVNWMVCKIEAKMWKRAKLKQKEWNSMVKFPKGVTKRPLMKK